MNMKIFLASLVLLLTMFAHSEGNHNSKLINLNTIVLPLIKKDSAVTVNRNKISFVSVENQKLLYNHGGNKKIISENIYSDHVWISSAGKYVHVFWWKKFADYVKGSNKNPVKGKILYVKSSQDNGVTFGDRHTISDAGAVLPKVKIQSDTKGNVNIVYLDERYAGTQIFTNSSQDGGVTWKKSDVRLDNNDIDEARKAKYKSAFSPNLGHAGNELISLWQQLDYLKNGKKLLRIFSRSSLDNGRTWEKQALVFETEKYSSSKIKLFSTDDQVYLIAGWQGQGISVFSKKEGQSWRAIKGFAPNSEKAKGGSYFKLAYDKDILYLSYLFVEKESSERRPWHLELVRIDRQKNSWIPNSVRLDSRGMGMKSRAGYQDIAVLQDGTVVVVWEDYRRILPMIALNYSIDQGTTWLRAPLVVSPQDTVNSSFFPFLKVNEGKYSIFYHNNTYPVGKKPKKVTLLLSMNSPKSSDFDKNIYLLKPLPTEKEMNAKLKQRFEKVKNARLEKKWINEWNVKDPVYRNRYKKGSWMATRNRLVYKEFKLDHIEIDFPFAYTVGKMKYDLSTDFIDAEEGDPRFTNIRKPLNLKWGWFNDNWYLTAEDPRYPYLP